MFMNVAITLSGERSRKLYDIFTETGYDTYQPVCIMETDSSLWDADASLPVVSFGKATQLYNSKKIDKFIIPSMQPDLISDVLNILNAYEIPIEDCLFAPVEVFLDDSLTAMERVSAIYNFSECRELPSMELHVIDNCNMRCKHCTMFAALAPPGSIDDFDSTVKGLSYLKKYFSHVHTFRVLGGEPFLNPRLYEYLDIIREKYPYTEIQLITNGTMLMDMSQVLINSIKNNHVTVYISFYKTLNIKADAIHDFLVQKGIQHSFTPPLHTFQNIYDAKGRSDALFTFNNCRWRIRGCATIKNTMIAPCFVPFAIKYFSDAFSLDIEQSGVIDLSEDGLSTYEIRRRLTQPFPLCRYCAPPGHSVKWEQLAAGSKPNIKDWCID